MRGLGATSLPLAPMMVAAVVGAGIMLATGVRPLEIVRLVGYEALFVVVPGVLVLRALCRRPGSPYTQLAIGWPLGYAIELIAFAATALAGIRPVFVAYPLIVGGAALLIARRRGGVRDAPRTQIAARGALPAWVTAAVAAIAVVLLGMGFFAANPLPRSVPSVSLSVDSVFDVAVAADALHHMPVADPNVAGEGLRYHVLVFLHAAGINQVTGVPLDVAFLRWLPIMAVLLLALEVAWLAGRAARGSPWIAPAAVALALFASELDVDPDNPYPFLGLFFTNIPLSPTFAFGLSFFVAATGVIVGVLARRSAVERGIWVVLGLLLAGAMGAKGSTLPVMLVGLGLFLVARLLLDRVLDRRCVAVLALTVGVFVAVYGLLFSGAGTGGPKIDPFAFLGNTVVGILPPGLQRVLGSIAVLAGLFAAWLGALLLIGRLRGEARLSALWLGALTLGSVAPFLVFSQPGDAQAYFLVYGVPGAVVLSAWGVASAWPAGLGRWPILVAGAVTVALAVVAATVLDDPVPPLLGGRYLAVYAGLVAAAAIAAIAAAVSVRRLALALPLGVALVVGVTLLDAPIDVVPAWYATERAGTQRYLSDVPTGPRGIDRERLAGFEWLRDHSDPDDVLAVDVQSRSAGDDPRYFYAAAYAQRRTFLAGWAYSAEAYKLSVEGRPDEAFAARRALNAAAFGGDARALAILRDRHHVRFVVSDLRVVGRQPKLDRLLPLAYANAGLRIYRLRAGTLG